MKFFVIIVLLFMCCFGSIAQTDTTGKIDMTKYQKVYMGDSSWVFVLKDLQIKRRDSYYYNMARKVKKMYPFAKHAVALLSDIDEDPTDSKVSKSSKKEAKKTNKKLKEDFRHTILEMTQSEGAILVKLIHRETGMTAYEIIKKYRGSAKAAYWQSLSKLGGADLKQKFNPKQDLALNRVMRDVDMGKLSVPKNPDMVTKDERKAMVQARKTKKKSKGKKG